MRHFLRCPTSLPMSSPATFCDAVVSTQFDSHATSSHVSLDWVINSGVPTRGSRLSGRLTLPCNTGGISILLSDVTVVASLPCDLVLGLDWVPLMRKSAQRVVVHLSSGPLDFRTPGSSIGVLPLNACISSLPLYHQSSHNSKRAQCVSRCYQCRRPRVDLVREIEYPTRMFDLVHQ
jgi:hypothetical protein